MSDRERLIDLFERGVLVRPGSGTPGFVDLVRAIAHSCGAEDIELNEHSRAMAEPLRRADHIVFLLADGLGVNFIDAMPRDAWLRRHTRRVIQAPFPSTTTAAVAAVATAEHPAQHAILGWWTHLPSIVAPVTVFTGERVQDEMPISTLGLTLRDLSPVDAVIPRMRRKSAVVQPASVAYSDFSRYLAGGARQIGYRSHLDAVEGIVDFISAADGPTYTYWYTSVPDSVAHEFGTGHSRVGMALAELDRAVAALDARLEELQATYRIVGTADHGHLDVGGAGPLETMESDPFFAHLRCPPSGDVRTHFWHVRPGEHAAFEAAFRARLGRWFVLLTTDEVDELRLIGPDPMSEETRRRAGDYTSISLGPEVLRYSGAGGRQHYLAQRSHHSGLTADEMLVPLILSEPGMGSGV